VSDFFERYVQKRLETDTNFKKAWEDSRQEYEIANQIIKLRKQKGWTQKDLADHTHTGQSYISRIENGDHSITLATLSKVAHALDAKLEIVLKENNKPFAQHE
jgi:transcriptional regulator with XRE-family HTH domain